MPAVTGVRAIVAAHGSLAEGLVSAVQAITGHGDALLPVSNTGLTGTDVVTTIGSALDATGARVVFTDLPAGSCTMAVRRLQRARPGLTIVMGVNLPMLLEFVLHDPLSAADLAAAVDRSRALLQILDTPHVG